MDGVGRLARSQRPQADLRAAALGAVILLREYVAAYFARRERSQSQLRQVAPKPAVERPQSTPVVELVEQYLPRRAGTIATLLLLLGSVWLGVIKGGHVEEFSTAFNDARNRLANSAGFRITAVAINGRKQLTQDEVLAIGGVTGRSSLLFLDALAVRDKLKANPWIREATVLKLYPGQLQIDIVERSPFALWQQDGRLSVISDAVFCLKNKI